MLMKIGQTKFRAFLLFGKATKAQLLWAKLDWIIFDFPKNLSLLSKLLIGKRKRCAGNCYGLVNLIVR